MLLIRAILLWSIISLYVVGGAAVFRRFFPKESPWFGFIVPSLALVIIMNFIEHMVAVPSLLWLLPFTTLGFIWAIFHPEVNWKGFRLPTGIFLASFAFTLTQRALRPDILGVRDGIPDLGLMASFCLGAKVPPPISWYPDLPLSHYYALGHYAMSVLTRLLGLDVGTGFNLSSALLSAFDYFIAAAAAWRISRQKVWITLLAPLLMAGSATGATVYLWFTVPNLDPNEADDIFSGLNNPNNHSPLLKLLHDGCRNELMPPGAWSWAGSFHSTCGGLFLVLFFVWALMEMLRRKATNWPWICVGAIPLLTIVTSTWALPFEGLLLLSALFWICYCKLFPKNFRFVLLGLGLVTAVLAPMLSEFLVSSTCFSVEWTGQDCRTQLVEFLVLWWPVYLPLVALVFVWPKISPAVKTIIVSLPIALLGVELYTVGNRYDWVGKVWCYIYGAGWITLVPALCRRRAIPLRLLTLVLIVSSLCSFWAWTSFVWHTIPWGLRDILHLEGTGPYRWDPVQSKLLLALSRVKGQTILTGKPSGGGSPPLAAFTGNRIDVAWWSFTDGLVGGAPWPMAQDRGRQVEDFYAGKCGNPLLFLRAHDISAVVIHPDDNIDTNIVDALKKKLAPYYEYIDCKQDKVNAGIFFFHPEMIKWSPEAILLSPDSNSSPPASGPGSRKP
jgi:hypothetical protein